MLNRQCLYLLPCLSGARVFVTLLGVAGERPQGFLKDGWLARLALILLNKLWFGTLTGKRRDDPYSTVYMSKLHRRMTRSSSTLTSICVKYLYQAQTSKCFRKTVKLCVSALVILLILMWVSFCWQRKDFAYEAISVLLTTVMTLWSWMTSRFLPWSHFHPHQACPGCPCRLWQNLLLACPCRCALPTDSLRLQASTPCQVSAV